MIRKKGQEIDSEDDLDRRKKVGDHNRGEKMKNALTKIICFFIFSIPFFVIVLIGYLLWMRETDLIVSGATHITAAAVGGLVIFFKQHGIAK